MYNTLEECILVIISQRTRYSYTTIKAIYDNLKSYDDTISIIDVSQRCNVSPNELIAAIEKLSVVGLDGAKSGKLLRETVQEILQRSNHAL